MTRTINRAALAAFSLAILGACTATKLETRAALPPPLLEQLPVRVGVYYSKEFREYVHRETRGTIDYEVNLGPAHVTNLDWLLKAMFREVVPVEDPAKIAGIQPPLVFVVEPKFEEYSFLTPKDVAGEAFIVTIRYLLTLYDGTGTRVDSFTFTGYGRERAHTLASKEPLAVATQRAMRDAGAKVAVELTDQESVRLLLHGVGSPLPASPPQPPEQLKPPPPFTPAQIPPITSESSKQRWPVGQPKPESQEAPPPAQEPAQPPASGAKPPGEESSSQSPPPGESPPSEPVPPPPAEEKPPSGP